VNKHYCTENYTLNINIMLRNILLELVKHITLLLTIEKTDNKSLLPR